MKALIKSLINQSRVLSRSVDFLKMGLQFIANQLIVLCIYLILYLVFISVGAWPFIVFISLSSAFIVQLVMNFIVFVIIKLKKWRFNYFWFIGFTLGFSFLIGILMFNTDSFLFFEIAEFIFN